MIRIMLGKPIKHLFGAGECYVERAAAVEFALEPDVPAVQLNQAASDVQAQAGATGFDRGDIPGSKKTAE